MLRVVPEAAQRPGEIPTRRKAESPVGGHLLAGASEKQEVKLTFPIHHLASVIQDGCPPPWLCGVLWRSGSIGLGRWHLVDCVTLRNLPPSCRSCFLPLQVCASECHICENCLQRWCFCLFSQGQVGVLFIRQEHVENRGPGRHKVKQHTLLVHLWSVTGPAVC